MAALNHPHICTLHDVGPNYLVMEYIEGEAPKGPYSLDHPHICTVYDVGPDSLVMEYVGGWYEFLSCSAVSLAGLAWGIDVAFA